MQRYMPGKLPQSGDWQNDPTQQRYSPLQAVVALGEHVRSEHGRAGAQRLVAALSPLLEEDLLRQASQQLGVPPPAYAPAPVSSPSPPKKGGPDMEQMLGMMQALQGGKGGLDPKILMQLMQKKGG